MNDPHQEFDGDETLHKDKVHEENKQNQQHSKDHENQHSDNNNGGAGRNPIHHSAGGK
jgi:hypothetical protein